MAQFNVFPGSGQNIADWVFPPNSKKVRLYRAVGLQLQQSNTQEIYQGSDTKFVDQQVQPGVNYTYQAIFYNDIDVEVGRSAYVSATPNQVPANVTQQLQPFNGGGWLRDHPKAIQWGLIGLLAILGVVIAIVLLNKNSKGAAGQVAGAGSGTEKVEKQNAATAEKTSSDSKATDEQKPSSTDDKSAEVVDKTPDIQQAQLDALNDMRQQNAAQNLAQIQLMQAMTDKLTASQPVPAPPADASEIQMEGSTVDPATGGGNTDQAAAATTSAGEVQQNPDCPPKKRPLTLDERVTNVERKVRRHDRLIKNLRTDVDRHESILKGGNLDGLTSTQKPEEYTVTSEVVVHNGPKPPASKPRVTRPE